MKRLILTLMCFSMVLGLAACGSSGSQSSTTSTTGTTGIDVISADATQASDGIASSTTASNSGSAKTSAQTSTTTKYTGSGVVVGQTNIKAAEWGIKTSSSGIESTANLKGKTVKMAVFNTARYTSAAFQRAVKAFESKYGCKVKINTFAFGDEYMNAISNSVAAGAPYDIAFIHGVYFYTAMGSNAYQSLNSNLTTADLLNTSTLKGIDLNKSVECSWKGKIYGVCGYRSVNPMLIFYNKKKFEREGLEDPRTLYDQGKWTWEKFIQIGLQVTKPSNGIYFGEFNFYRTEVVATFGGATIDWNTSTPVANLSNKALLAGYKHIQSLVRGTNQVIKLQGSEDQLENFCNGTTFVYTEESDRYITIMNKIPTLTAFAKKSENLGIVPFPLGSTNTSGAYPTGWIEVAASPKGSNPAAAVAWIKHYSSYDDPVSDKTSFNSNDQKMINKLLSNILPRRCGFQDSSNAAASLEGRITDAIAKGGDISQIVKEYEPKIQSCINATLSQLSKIQ